MPWFWLVIVALPFLELPMLANLKGGQFAARSLYLRQKLRILAKDAARIKGAREEFAHDLDVHRRSHCQRMFASIRKAIAILRRDRWTGDQMPRAVVDEIIEKKLRSIVQNWPCTFAQKLLIERESIVIPCVQREPRSAHRPDAPLIAVDRLRIAPEIGIVVNHEATRTVVLPGHLCAGSACRCARHVNQIDQRKRGLAKSCRFSEPIVHLGVDVDGPLRTPWVVDARRPDALQICRQTIRARGTDQQVACEFEIELLQPQIIRAAAHT